MVNIDLHQFNEIVKTFNATFPSPQKWVDLLKLRCKLIDEEVDEFHAEIKDDVGHFLDKIDKERTAKELADVLFVVLGAFDTLELDLEAAMAQVGTKNFNKVRDADKMVIREDGKVVKPDEAQYK